MALFRISILFALVWASVPSQGFHTEFLMRLRGGMGKAKASANPAKMSEAVPSNPKKLNAQSIEVRHILVEKHSKALEIIEQLNSGQLSFVDAAKQHSTDKASRGGLLGWKRKAELDQDFWLAAVAQADGAHSKQPVRTRFGYHIIRVEARK